MKYLTILLCLLSLCLFPGACKHREQSCCASNAIMTVQPVGPDAHGYGK